MSDNRPKQTLLNTPRYKLTAMVKKGDERGYANLSLSYNFNKLQINLWPGFKGDKGLYMQISDTTFYMWLDALMSAATNKEFKDIRFNLTKGLGGKELLGELIVGRDDDGVVWTTAHAEGFQKIKFPLLYPDNTKVTYLDGSEMSKRDLSALRTTGYTKALMHAVSAIITRDFDPNAGARFNDNKGGGRSGGGGSSMDFDDDIPGGW